VQQGADELKFSIRRSDLIHMSSTIIELLKWKPTFIWIPFYKTTAKLAFAYREDK